MSRVKKAIIAVAFFVVVMMFGTMVSASADTYAVTGVDIYLALRNAKAFDYSNEIGKLYTDETVEVQTYDSGTYWYVYSPKLNKYGYVNKNYLRYVGSGSSSSSSYGTYTVKVDSGYLALRTAMAYDYNNEIGSLYTGETVQVYEKTSSTYWYVYSPKLDRYGYVNCNYLVGGSGSSVSGATYSVKVDSGYLALRTAKAYDYNNEIGAMYTGEQVIVQDTSDSTYWYVYSPKLGKSGYTNKNYLVYVSGGSSSSSYSGTKYTVKVDSGYLALRTAMAYDSSNEIGSLYTGDTVYVQQKTSSTYWYVYSPKYDRYGYVNCNYLK